MTVGCPSSGSNRLPDGSLSLADVARPKECQIHFRFVPSTACWRLRSNLIAEVFTIFSVDSLLRVGSFVSPVMEKYRSQSAEQHTTEKIRIASLASRSLACAHFHAFNGSKFYGNEVE